MAYLTNGKQLNCVPDIRDSMYRLRKRVFADQLGWQVNVQGGMEFDEFDRDDTIYVLYLQGREVAGIWRILPTTGPYMLADIFPQLAPDTGIPRDKTSWELSRYCMDKDAFGNEIAMHRAQLDMFCTLAEFSILYGVEELVLVQDPRITKLANSVFGVPHIMTMPTKTGVCLAHTVLYRPSFLKDLRQAQQLYGIGAPATECLDVLALGETRDGLALLRAAE